MPTEVLDSATIAKAMSEFFDVIDETLARIPHTALLSPDYREFNLRRGDYSELVAKVPVTIAPGATVELIAPVPHTSDDEIAFEAKLRSRVEAVLAGLDRALALRADLTRSANDMFDRGLHGRLLAVRLASIDLSHDYDAAPFEVQVAGEADDTLRPFGVTWPISDLDDLVGHFDEFQGQQSSLVPLRNRAHALGAVGFIDPLALALAERLPGGQRLAMRDVARRQALFWNLSSSSRCECTSFEWRRGVVRGWGRLSDDMQASGDRLEVATAISQAAVGDALGEHIDQPYLSAFRITSVLPCFSGGTQIVLDAQPVPFTADGELLAPD